MDNLQEAYLRVYEANDSYLETDMEKRKKNNEKALKDMEKTDAHKDMVATARKKFDESTAMSRRGYDEAPIRQKIAKSTGGGASADRATSLEDRPTYGDKNKEAQRSRYARTQRGDFRKTASSNSGLHGYAHKATNPADKAKQDARGAQRGALTPNEKKQLNREEVDLFDYLLEYLVAEGYADTNVAAIAIMSNMSEEWREEILDEANKMERNYDVPNWEKVYDRNERDTPNHTKKPERRSSGKLETPNQTTKRVGKQRRQDHVDTRGVKQIPGAKGIGMQFGRSF